MGGQSDAVPCANTVVGANSANQHSIIYSRLQSRHQTAGLGGSEADGVRQQIGAVGPYRRSRSTVNADLEGAHRALVTTHIPCKQRTRAARISCLYAIHRLTGRTTLYGEFIQYSIP